MDLKFRTLRADEIECRVATVSEKGCSLLLYKDARVDQNMLDEEVGAMNWQKSYTIIDGQLFCTISIWDSEKGQWVSKQDVGTESYAEAEKGRASDAQKRAAFCFGIGRELYTAPFIWIGAENVNLTNRNGKLTTYDSFKVREIDYNENREIVRLTIANTKRHQVVYQMIPTAEQREEIARRGAQASQNPAIEEAEAKARVMGYINRKGWDKCKIEALCHGYKVASLKDLTLENCNHYIQFLESKGVKIDE